MSHRSNTAELTNMVMIQDPVTKKVLLQKRELSWKGVTFPGGHVERGESFYQSAVREMKEETGLTVSQLQFCGVTHWCNLETDARYLVFLYRTTCFSGQVLERTEEGPIFWASLDEIPTLDCSPHFLEYLPMFLRPAPGECFGQDGAEPIPLQYF